MTAVAADFGLDLWCEQDLDPRMPEVNGLVAFAQALARRLDTPRNMLIDDQDYGYDLVELVSRGMTPDELAAIPGRIVAELRKDERVDSVVAVVALASLTTLILDLRVRSSLGPFKFTVAIADAKVAVLNVLPEAA